MKKIVLYFLFISLSNSVFSQDLTEEQIIRVQNVVRQYCRLITDFSRDEMNINLRSQIEDLFPGEYNTTSVFDDLKTDNPIQLRDYLTSITQQGHSFTFTFRNIETAPVHPAFMSAHPTMKFGQVEIVKEIRQLNKTLKNVFIVNLSDGKIWGIDTKYAPFRNIRASTPSYSPSTTSISSASATIDNIRTEFDVFENNMKGVKIHIKFSIAGMQNKQGSCSAWFYFSDGTILKDFNNNYQTVNGQVSTYDFFTPRYQSSTFEDFVLFIPYEELHLRPGATHNLKFDVGIFDDKNNLIATSDYKYFNYTPPNVTAKLEEIWTEHNVFENNRKGMRIYVKFSIVGMQNKQGICAVWFYFSDGTALTDTYNSPYRTNNGHVATQQYFRPGYENTIYDDFDMFFPYDELRLSRYTNLKYQIGIFDDKSNKLVSSDYVYFNYTPF